ncbi:MAG: TlpA family protein disulfide reductase, partial [Proteobacteria bacterium]|nr:TlpA family protein disulfide reductase [Pseudomonadota bacterium]
MNRPLVYAAIAVVVSALIAVALTQTGNDSPDPGAGPVANVEALITGQVANFTLSEPAKTTPEVTFLDASGQSRSFADFHGKVVLVNFWA